MGYTLSGILPERYNLEKNLTDEINSNQPIHKNISGRTCDYFYYSVFVI